MLQHNLNWDANCPPPLTVVMTAAPPSSYGSLTTIIGYGSLFSDNLAVRRFGLASSVAA